MSSIDVDRLFDEMASLVARRPPADQVPAKLHVGEEAWIKLRVSLGWRPIPGSAASQIYSVPIVVGAENGAVPLDPYGWRLISQAGTVIFEGVLTP